MEVRCSASPGILVKTSGPVMLPASRHLIAKYHQVHVRRSASLQIRACIKNKVYEDSCQGIVCYTDDSGQIVCEGYDEGPRFQPPTPKTFHPRDAEIMDILQQKWLQIVSSDEINHAGNCTADLQEDLNSSGHNSFI